MLEARLILEIAYQGTNYCGMVRQENGDTVAARLDHAIAQLDPEASRLIATSRTDAGVHALRQPISFITKKPQIGTRSWVLALRPHLPRDISIVSASYFPLDYDPRRHTRAKLYEYRVLASNSDHAFEHGRSYRVGQTLDLDLMRREAETLLGTYDFAAFRSVQDLRTDTVRTLSSVEIREEAGHPKIITIAVLGDRFMHNMVRIIAGTLLDIGRGRVAPGAVRRALDSKRRQDLGMTAPAEGLYLSQVYLDREGDDFWPPEARIPSPEP